MALSLAGMSGAVWKVRDVRWKLKGQKRKETGRERHREGEDKRENPNGLTLEHRATQGPMCSGEGSRRSVQKTGPGS